MKFVIYLAAFAAALFLAFFLFSPKEDAQTHNLLIVGTNAEYPPYTFIEDRQIVGFDIDVAQEIAKRLQKEIRLEDKPFDSLLPSLMLGKIDLIAAGMSPTEERARKVSFSIPYYNNDALVIVSLENNPLATIESLKGKKVVVNEGYTADTFASNIEGLNLLRLPTPPDALFALKSGRADAFITASNTLRNFIDKEGVKSYAISALDHSSDGIALVIAKKNTTLLEEVNKALEDMSQDGTLDQLKAKWDLP